MNVRRFESHLMSDADASSYSHDYVVPQRLAFLFDYAYFVIYVLIRPLFTMRMTDKKVMSLRTIF